MGGDAGDFLEKGLDIVTQLGTFGTVGFEDGAFGKGVTTKQVKSTLKDVTGATAAEEATEQARERFEEEKKAAGKQREEIKAQTARDQLVASRLAGGARRAGATTAGKGKKSTSLGSDTSDFLGL